MELRSFLGPSLQLVAKEEDVCPSGKVRSLEALA